MKTKKMLAMALTLVMGLTLLFTPALADDSDFIIRNGALVDYYGPGGDVAIPDGVIEIADRAFASCHGLTGVTIPDSVVFIGEGAFTNCGDLTDVTIPGSVVIIGIEAFSGCSSLTDVTLLNGVSEIGIKAFYACPALTRVTIPDSVTAIGANAFSGCASLTDIALPDSITVIESNTFSNCDSLTSVTIPDSVTTIKEDAFFRCANLTRVTIPHSVTSIGSGAFYDCDLTDVYYGGSPDEWEVLSKDGFGNYGRLLNIHYDDLPDEGFEIQNGLLVDYNGLDQDVTIPEGVTAIANNALGDNRLTSLTIPCSVTAISKEAFHSYGNLKRITVAAGNPAYSSKNGALLNKDGTELICCPRGMEGVYSIPAGVTTIKERAVNDCDKLTGVTIPDGVTTIEEYAFADCDGLTNVTIPGSVSAIGENAFAGCDKLSEATILDGVSTIGDSAFRRCKALIRVTIPVSVKKIDHMAFDECPRLGEVFYTGSKTAWEALLEANTSIYSKHPALQSAAIHYGNAAGTPGGSGGVVINDPDFEVNDDGVLVEYLGDGGDVVIPKGVTSIGVEAFSSCYKLTGVTIPDSVTSIGQGAFQFCNKLTRVTIPNSVTRIGKNAFYNCERLSGVTIPDSVVKIGEYAFCNCKRLTSVTIPKGVTAIESCTFNDCASLTKVSIPVGVNTIGVNAFGGCEDLTDVYYGGTAAQWKEIKLVGYHHVALENATIHYSDVKTAPAATTATAYASTQTVLVDGKRVTFCAYALKDANGYDTNYIKLRDVAYVLNGSAAQFQVDWDGAIAITTRRAYTANGSEMIQNFTGDQSCAVSRDPVTVNGKDTDIQAITLTDARGGGYTYFKLRDLGQALGFDVSWNARTGISIDPNSPYNANS